MAPKGSRGKAIVSARGSTSNAKVSRGGINKRRNARTDGDGDLDMDGGARRTLSKRVPDTNSKKGKVSAKAVTAIARHLGADLRNGRTNGRSKKSKSENWSWVRVTGLKESKAANNPGGGTVDLIAFLERKATALAARTSRTPISIKKHRLIGDHVYVAAGKEHASDIIKCNGFTFAGVSLEIVASDPPDTTETTTKSTESVMLENGLKAFLGSRYVPEAKLLKLDSLAQDEFIVANGLLSTMDRANKLFRILMKICSDLFPTRKAKQDAVQSITITQNSISSVEQIDALATTFPDLKNLDLRHNQIVTLDALVSWKTKLRRLETLLVDENPIDATISTNDYRPVLVEWFPSLQNLNNVVVRTPEQAAAATKAHQPRRIPNFGASFRDVNNIGSEFLVDFLTTYDSNRALLISKYYDKHSTFSLAVDTSGVRDPNAPPPMPWASYLKFSRNLTKITHHAARVQRLFTGGSVIGELWSALPPTRHPDIRTDMSKYVADCSILHGLSDPTGQAATGVDGMIITLHGEFEELDPASGNTGKRSFSRTFILGPTIPGRDAIPIRVVSDMLSLKAYHPLPSVDEAVADTSAPQPPVADMEALVMELAKRTGMTPEFCQICLSDGGVNWDLDRAIMAFEQNKNNLPPEAFAVPPSAPAS